MRSSSTARGVKFAFSTLRYTRAKNLRFITLSEEIHSAECKCQLPSVVKEQPSHHQLPVGTSSRPGKRKVKGKTTLRAIKNPASSAGRFRLYCGPISAWPLGRKCSKLDLCLPGSLYQSHLWMSGKPGSSVRTPLSQACADIRKYYQVSSIRQAYSKLFFRIHLWKTHPMWITFQTL